MLCCSMVRRTSVVALLAALLALVSLSGRRVAAGAPVPQAPVVPDKPWLPALERHLLLRQLGFVEPLPPSWREVSNGVTARAPGMSLWVSQAVGLAPLRLAIRWRVELRPEDRSLELVAVEDESEMVTHRSDTSITEPGQTTRTVNAHWELGASGRYVVAGCVRPRGACVGQTVAVS